MRVGRHPLGRGRHRLCGRDNQGGFTTPPGKPEEEPKLPQHRYVPAPTFCESSPGRSRSPRSRTPAWAFPQPTKSGCLNASSARLQRPRTRYPASGSGCRSHRRLQRSARREDRRLQPAWSRHDVPLRSTSSAREHGHPCTDGGPRRGLGRGAERATEPLACMDVRASPSIRRSR
jgi:hypothetical protein